ncbi:MAG: hypothetical protein BWY82_03037 [Verrucomicrobia bacterium ADurb.Bin474]|nr:MAG: hypothetical protein BWY82_03037 [Verrucomicrobia bacterium ADurb.Bin474]
MAGSFQGPICSVVFDELRHILIVIQPDHIIRLFVSIIEVHFIQKHVEDILTFL